TIKYSYEGLEASDVIINKGRIYIIATDDGINAAGGSTNGTDGGQSFFGPGSPDQGGQTAGDYSIVVNGGKLYINCGGDGLDSNGDLTLTGGEICSISQPAGGDNSPYDADGAWTINGATIFGAGTNALREAPASSSQKYTTSTASRSSGSNILVKYNGTLLFNVPINKNINYTIYSAPGVNSVYFETYNMADACLGTSWMHNWDAGVVSDGIITYTCADCGMIERKTVTGNITGGNESGDNEGLDENETELIPVDSYEYIVRLAGDDRFATSILAAEALKSVLGVDKFENVVVACGTDFPDALAGSYLANKKNAPVLLVADKYMATVTDYIKANLASDGEIYVLGGTGVVSTGFESAMGSAYADRITRLGGKNRYETNLLILQEAGVEDEDIIVSTGNNYADSLSASATGLPILLVTGKLLDYQTEFLEALGGDNNIVIAGGTGAVGLLVENELSYYGDVERLAGANRFETSTMLAEKYFENPENWVMAYGANFPDGLSGGPLAAALGAPLLLSQNANVAINAGVAYAENLLSKPNKIYILGGTTLISNKTAATVYDAAGNVA
ncbi:MAG: cell wall-binding repeat-containing protein, partial [Lachnospiraceae bacterium]|nr:cell wall-binding repeat-containing protein [Lachnospiraceae bacterium]